METTGYNGCINMGDGATPEVFTPIASVSNITVPDESAPSIDTSHLKTLSNVRTFIGGMIDGGSITFTMHFLPKDASHDYLTGIRSNLGKNVNFQIEFPDVDNTVYGFNAVVTNVGGETLGLDELIQSNVTLKISGPTDHDVTP